jgi:hypothetical protein
MRRAVARQLVKAANGIPIVSVTWFPFNLGDNMVIGEQPRSKETINKQIVIGARALDVDVVYLAEHDVLYHASHFDHTPSGLDVLCYNENKWRFRLRDGAVAFRQLRGTKIYCLSQMAGYRTTIIDHYTKELCRNKEKYMSSRPNIDIRHKDNLTNPPIFSRPSIRADGVPFWGQSKDIMKLLRGKEDDKRTNTSKKRGIS